MPIYEYYCGFCKQRFEKIERVSSISFKKEKKRLIICPFCNRKKAYKIPSKFKKGSGVLETTGKSGYETDELTLGKIIDDGGIPYEFKDEIRKRSRRIDETKEYVKGLKERAKKYKFDPFSSDDEV